MIYRSAIFSDCLKYRYVLTAHWGETTNRMVWLMLNPSTATEMENDPTIERCQNRAKDLGYHGITILNLFAYRATDPKDMKSQLMPVGDDNDHWIEHYARSNETIYCGWGSHGGYLGRSDEVKNNILSLGCNLMALDSNKDGSPVHPLYQPYEKGFKDFS